MKSDFLQKSDGRFGRNQGLKRGTIHHDLAQLRDFNIMANSFGWI